MDRYPNILTIAGSDSGGGAGIQADIKTMTVLRCFGMSVITALTAQNGAEVTGIHAAPPDFVALQYKTVLDGFRPDAAKTGMLMNSGIMEVLAELLKKRDFPLVVDPVCVSQSGHALLEKSALETLRKKIVPLADLLTPNIPEAQALTGLRISAFEQVQEAVKALRGLGARNVLIKGGHFAEQRGLMTDWLGLENGQILSLSHRRVDTPNNHGTGCALSAAIASQLGSGYGLEEAVRRAQDFLLRALEQSFTPGKGAGPVNFLAGAGPL
jgi:hydroxymethylpyrimidine/phosphomethylpyrimidine kinase